MANKPGDLEDSKKNLDSADKTTLAIAIREMFGITQSSSPDPEIVKDMLKLESKKQDHDQQRFYILAIGAVFLIVFFVVAVTWVQSNDKLVSLFGGWLDRIIFLGLGGSGGFIYGKFKRDD